MPDEELGVDVYHSYIHSNNAIESSMTILCRRPAAIKIRTFQGSTGFGRRGARARKATQLSMDSLFTQYAFGHVGQGWRLRALLLGFCMFIFPRAHAG